ncbi:hypothetical protein [Ornithinibacillus sp. JPR2-1]|uniref:hypothetical protein n=1 Tax=Ornithinibacillus sp. JPR2-1 TaxID=2094019 RepID=UPI0031D59D56
MIKIQNKHLGDVADFLLNTITAKGKKNIHRMRIVNALKERNKGVGEEELELLKEYAKKDEDDNVVQNENGRFVMEDAKEFKKQQDALYEEYFVIDDVNLKSALRTVEKLVNDYDKELVGKEAEAHFILVEAFEEVEVSKTEEEQA